MTEQLVTVSLPAERWAAIAADLDLLAALKRGGVDDWEWFGDALDTLRDVETIDDALALIKGAS